MPRIDGRVPDELRPIEIVPNVNKFAEGSCLIRYGNAHVLKEMPVRTCVAAISAGVVDEAPILDLCYEEGSAAQVDLNCVMTGEGRPFTIKEQRILVDLCSKGIREVQAVQRAALGG